MPANPDFKDLFAAFNDAEVRFMVVGAYALIHHSEPRFTKDLDVWVDPTEDNARRVFDALRTFGAPLDGVTPADFTDREMVFQIGIEPNRIDVLMAVTGLEFVHAFERADETRYDDIPIRVLSLDDLITNKKALGRSQDLVDLELLEVVKSRM